MDERGAGWERAAGPVSGGLLLGAGLLLFGGAAAAIGLSTPFGFVGFTPGNVGQVGSLNVPFGGLPGPGLRERLELALQAVNVTTAVLLLAAVVIAAFAAPHVPSVARRVAGLGVALGAILAIGALYGMYDAFDPPGPIAIDTTWEKIANAAPRGAVLVVAATSIWLAMRTLSPPASLPTGDEPPTPVELAP